MAEECSTNLQASSKTVERFPAALEESSTSLEEGWKTLDGRLAKKSNGAPWRLTDS
jgi:hypothetical protein